MHEKGREADRKKKSGWDRRREKAASAFVLSPVQKYMLNSIADKTTLVSSITKKKKILQTPRQVWVYHTPNILPPDSKYSPVSSAPPLCISQSFPDRNPLLQWGYILPQWIPAPVDTLGSPAPDLTPPTQADYPPAPPDWNTHQTDM